MQKPWAQSSILFGRRRADGTPPHPPVNNAFPIPVNNAAPKTPQFKDEEPDKGAKMSIYEPEFSNGKGPSTKHRVFEKPSTVGNEGVMFSQALAKAIDAAYQSGLTPAEFIRRLTGALGVAEGDLKKTPKDATEKVSSHEAKPAATVTEYQWLPMYLLSPEIIQQYNLPKSIKKYVHREWMGGWLPYCKRNSDGKWAPVLKTEINN